LEENAPIAMEMRAKIRAHFDLSNDDEGKKVEPVETSKEEKKGKR
jgi:hypothetical protein